MGKVLIIKDADFSENAITTTPTNKCIPTTVFNEGFWNYLTGIWYDNNTLGRNCNTKHLCVVGGKNYTINNPLENMHYDIVFLDADKGPIDYIGGSSQPPITTDLSFTTPSNCYYLCFNLYTASSMSSNPPAQKINGIKITGSTADALVYEEES